MANRPIMGEQLSREQLLERERKATLAKFAQERQASQSRRRSALRVLEQGFPLLEQYVDLSPVEVVVRGRRFRADEARIIGGWPISSYQVFWSESRVRDEGSQTEYVILTEDRKITASVTLDDERRLYDATDLSYPFGDLSLEHLAALKVDGYANNRVNSALTESSFRRGIDKLLDESGVVVEWNL